MRTEKGKNLFITVRATLLCYSGVSHCFWRCTEQCNTISTNALYFVVAICIAIDICVIALERT